MADQTTSLAGLSSGVWHTFIILKREAQSKDDGEVRTVALPQGFELETLLDLFARFRLWAGNIGALQESKASLDYRLRHSELRKDVARLLTQTLSALSDCQFRFFRYDPPLC